MEVLSINRIGNRIARHIETISSAHIAGKGLSFDRFMTNALHAMNYTVYETPRFRPRMAGVFWYQGYPIVLCALLSGSFISLPYSPLLTMLLGVFAITVIAMGFGWDKAIGLFSGSRASAGSPYRNLIALHPEQDKPYNIVFAAKYSRYRRLFSRRFSNRLFGGIAVSTIVTAAVLITSAFTGISRLWALPSFFAAYSIAIVLMFNKLVTSPGIRRNNASATAVLLELAHTFATEQPNANLVFVTGEASEQPDMGISGVFEDPEFAMTFPPERTTVIHIEESGTGNAICISDKYGFPIMQTGILFSRLTKEVCAKFGIECKSRWQSFGVDSPAAQTMLRGYSSIGLSTCGKKHTPKAKNHHITSHEFLFAVAQEIVDSIPRIRQSQNV